MKKGQSFSGDRSEGNDFEEVSMSTVAPDVSSQCGCQHHVLIFKDIKCIGPDYYSCLMDNGKIVNTICLLINLY